MDFWRKNSVQPGFFGLAVPPAKYDSTDDEQLLRALKLESENQPEAARLIYSKLVEKGHAEAQFKLGVMDLEKDPVQAFSHIQNAARQGHAQAIHQLGILYKTGQGCEQSYENAFNCFKKVAEQIPNAMFNLGYFYYRGCYVIQDVAMAFECFTKAAAESDLDAVNALGTIYQRGCGDIKADPIKGYQLFLHAAQQGHGHALANLGMMHLDGSGVKKDISIAIQYFKQSVDKNNVRALFQLIEVYKQNPGVMKTDPQAMDYYRMAVNAILSLKQSADKNNVRALFQLIEIYEKNPDMMKEDPQARGYYSMAADRGDARANCKVGQWYDEASARSGTTPIRGVVESDLRIGSSLAMTHLEKAARRDNSEAMRILGDKYFNGTGVKKDLLQAARYYRDAAWLGDKVVISKLRSLSSVFQEEKNVENAFNCSFSAATLGDNESLHEMLKMLGNVNEISYLKFWNLIREGCDEGNPDALYIGGCMVQGDRGIASLRSAAEKGFLKAHLALGDFYNQDSSGLFGTSEDFSKAIYHYKLIQIHEPSVIFKLAKLHKEGWSGIINSSIPPDGIEALGLYELVVEKDPENALAAYRSMAEIYENGIGVEKNRQKAAECREWAEELVNDTNNQKKNGLLN